MFVTAFVPAMRVLFIVAWFVAAAAWLYGTRFFFPLWVEGFRKSERYAGYRKKVCWGYGVFLLALAVGFAAGEWGDNALKREQRGVQRTGDASAFPERLAGVHFMPKPKFDIWQT